MFVLQGLFVGVLDINVYSFRDLGVLKEPFLFSSYNCSSREMSPRSGSSGRSLGIREGRRLKRGL